MSRTRILFLDDSGKPSLNDQTNAVVLGGFSIPSDNVPALSRRVAAAKVRLLPRAGDPSSWEVKSRRLLRPKNMRRSRFPRFMREIVRILRRLGCTVYTVSIDKRLRHHEMTLESTMQMQLHAVAEHFAAECRFRHETGLMISDWSGQRLDTQVSRWISEFVTSNRLPMHPSVYFADSAGSVAIQVADIVAGLRRRSVEGDVGARYLEAEMSAVRALPITAEIATHSGRRHSTQIELI